MQSIDHSSNSNAAPVASIVIPAHNEASVIERLLDSLPTEVGGRGLEVIVACNGCTDDTAEIARRRGLKVVDIETPSKIAALNAADEIATAFPRLYIDADVVLTPKTVTDLIRTLGEPGVLCAAPPYRLQLDGRPWTVRAYFSVWLQVMRVRAGYVGSGVYSVSEQGRKRFGKFPNVIADDTFVRNLFTRDERRIVDTDPTLVEAPFTLRALFRRKVRVTIGNMELRARAGDQPAAAAAEVGIPWWRVVLGRPTLIPAGVVYAFVNAAAHYAAHRQLRRKGSIDWARDGTTRSTPAV